MPEFDKYAPFVWWAYAIAGGILVALVIGSVARLARARRRLEEAEREDNP
jgi:heme exporter protein CcmD